MYIKDGICYAGELKEGIKVTDAKPLRGGMMLVTFSTGEQRLFDTTLLQGTAFEPLKDEKIFSNPVIFHGVITWDNGEIDIAPETVYKESYAYAFELDALRTNDDDYSSSRPAPRRTISAPYFFRTFSSMASRAASFFRNACCFRSASSERP